MLALHHVFCLLLLRFLTFNLQNDDYAEFHTRIEKKLRIRRRLFQEILKYSATTYNSSRLSEKHPASISSLVVPLVGLGSVPWVRHALTHSTDLPLLPVVTEDNSLSQLESERAWLSTRVKCVCWYVRTIDHIHTCAIPRWGAVLALCSFLQVKSTAWAGWLRSKFEKC